MLDAIEQARQTRVYIVDMMDDYGVLQEIKDFILLEYDKTIAKLTSKVMLYATDKAG